MNKTRLLIRLERLAALEAQASLQRGALAESRDQSARQSGEIFKMMQDLDEELTHTRARVIQTQQQQGNSTPGHLQTQPTDNSSHPGASLLGEVIRSGADESLNARIESLHEAIAASVCDLRGQVLTVTD